jgi:uncharacterized protein YbcC (UPF0753/DUF2309 family)
MLVNGVLPYELHNRHLTEFLDPYNFHLKRFIIKVSLLILDQGQKKNNMGQREEAQTWSRAMMVVHLHNGEENIRSHIREGHKSLHP